MQMFLGMCNDTTSQKVQEPSTGMAFDKMCCIQCATCRFIHTNFYNLCIQRQTCYFRNLLIMFLHSKKNKKKKEGRGLGNKEACCSSWLGCQMGSHGSAPFVMLQLL